MCYSVMDYARSGFLFPLFALIVVFLLAILIARILAKKRFPVYAVISPILIYGFLFFTGMALFAEGFQYPVIAFFQSDAPVQTTAGQVMNIQEAPCFPVYYDCDSHSFLPAMLVTVNDEDYYVLHSDIEIGQWLRLTWITDERVVLSWTEAEQAVAEQPPANDSMDQDAPQKNSVAQVVIYGSAILFLVLLSFQYLFGRKISEYLQKMDRQYSDGVIPNRLGILHFIILVFPVFGILIGWGANGFHGAFFLAIMVSVVLISVLIKKQTTYLILDGEKLIFSEFRTTHVFQTAEITNVNWGTSKIPNNRCLIIKFRSGYSIILEQESYWGLGHMYHQLNQKELRQKQRDIQE